jgi:ribosomal protein S18 acetylase RimI-like enzyme
MIRFRDIATPDIEGVVELWTACGLTRPWNDPYKDIAFAMTGPASTILLGEEEGAIVASAMVGHDGHRGMLYYVAVHPGHRRRGLGRQAVKAAETWLGERGVWKVNLLVRSENEAVQRFYERLGYEVNPVFCMARRLTGPAA